MPTGRAPHRGTHRYSQRELRALLERTDASVERILALARRHLDLEVAFIGRIEEGRRVIEAAVDRTGADAGLAGRSDLLDYTYCRLVAEGRLQAVVADARCHPRLAAMPATRQYDIRAHVGVPIGGPDGDVWGTLCGFAHQPRPDLDGSDEAVLRLLAGIIAERIEEAALVELEQRVTRDQLQAMMDEERIGIVFQPIIELRSGAILGYEALSRFESEVDQGPERWFFEARRVGMGIQLQAHVLARTLAHLEEIPASQFLSVNLSPASLPAPAILGILQAVPAGRVVVELTEHDRGDEARLKPALHHLREAGVRIAMDDVGAGHAGLRRVLRVAPELIKLDRQLVNRVHLDPARRALIKAVRDFATSVGALLVAEGVECAEEASVLATLGLDAAQGYHYGVPRARPWRARGTSGASALRGPEGRLVD